MLINILLNCFYSLEILIRFDLEEHREFVGVENDVHYDPKWKLRDINKMDKKMAKLWHQAELSGFSSSLHIFF